MRNVLAFSLLTPLLWISLGSADLVTPRPPDPKEKIAPLGIRSYAAAFKANEPARAMMKCGDWTCMGLYVFDAQGNCLARDDKTKPLSNDGPRVEWVPSVEERNSVEVRNLGQDVNELQLTIR